jgi:hypothetical protein
MKERTELVGIKILEPKIWNNFLKFDERYTPKKLNQVQIRWTWRDPHLSVSESHCQKTTGKLWRQKEKWLLCAGSSIAVGGDCSPEPSALWQTWDKMNGWINEERP